MNDARCLSGCWYNDTRLIGECALIIGLSVVLDGSFIYTAQIVETDRVEECYFSWEITCKLLVKYSSSWEILKRLDLVNSYYHCDLIRQEELGSSTLRQNTKNT